MPSKPPEPEIRTPIRPDASDERDHLYEGRADDAGPRPDRWGYETYRHYVGTTWHQRGEECTGFALASIANYVIRRQLDDPTVPSVSRRMLYELAQIHDGEDYQEGSTLRGALKGWQRTGVARDDLWPYDPDDEFGERHGTLTLGRLLDARHRPLLTYRRIPRDDLERMRDALADGHALFVGAQIHAGWYRLFMPEVEPKVERRSDDEDKGGHAFVIVGYDDDGFWVHNSWGPEWGTEGYALLPYDDWLATGRDAWVVDVEELPASPLAGSAAGEAGADQVASYRDLWPHLVVLRDDGKLASDGLYEMDQGSVGTLMYLFGERTASWPRRRLAVFCDSGALPTSDTIERYRAVRDRLIEEGIYPIFVVWETAWFDGLVDELTSWIDRLAMGGEPRVPLERGDALAHSAVTRSVARPIWGEVERRARLACEPAGGAGILAAAIGKKRTKIPFDLHVVAHGAGDLLQTRLLPLLPAPVATATTVDPATPIDQATAAYRSMLDDGRLSFLDLVTLAGDDEQHRTGPLRGSLLAAVDDLLAGRAAGVSSLGAPSTDRSAFDAARDRGSFAHEVWAAPGHVELGWEPTLWDRVVATMHAHVTDEPEPGTSPAATTGTGWSFGSADGSLPTDPLAYAEAMRDRRQA